MDKGALRIAAIPLSRAAEGNDGSDVGLLELQFNALVRPAALVAPRSRFEVRLAGRWNHGLAIRELQHNRQYHVLTRQNVTLHHQKPISSHVPDAVLRFGTSILVSFSPSLQSSWPKSCRLYARHCLL